MHYLGGFFAVSGLMLLWIDKRIYAVSGWHKEKTFTLWLGIVQLALGLLSLAVHYFLRYSVW
ncbi:CLC_0170 family protein [Paenibacillus sp. GbtcB18]|uniref:CLC_0170 family protein n=1 Tax=Paenibacillus sp. GbtcB18 TaxID=2824763 RepID=UPI001C2F61C3|nr:CLC_0170 family protein [Paenibacillus sp. GbtcB18]